MSGSKLSDASFRPDASLLPSPPTLGDQPLGLTVHAIPALGQAVDAVNVLQRTARGRWRMLMVMLVCAAPVVASYFAYYVIRPQGQSSYGELINPQRGIPEWPVVDLAGNSKSVQSLKGQWLLIAVAGGACDAACEQRLYLQRQLRESLGKGKDRLDWVWFINDAAPVKPALLPGLQQAAVLRADPAELSSWLVPANGRALEDHLYVVDPMGNWMMRFPADLGAATVARSKRDLERLLRASAPWDTAGR